MSINMSTQGVEIARYAGAMYGIVLDDATVLSVENEANANPTAGLNAVVNSVYTADFGSATNASVAAIVATNLGLKGTLSTEAQTYIVGQLNAAPAGTQGATIMTILNMFGGMTSDPTWGAAATAWENRVSAAVTYGQNTGNTSNSAISAMSPVASPVIYMLTTGIDNFTPAGNSTINGVISSTAANSTFNALDSIKATGTGNTLNIADQAGGVYPMVTVTGVQTANIQSVGAVTLDTSGWTGLTALNLTASTGADVITAASTAATTVTNTLAAAASPAATTIDGGTTVTLTATGATNSTDVAIGNIIVGGTTAATGDITITATETSAVALSTFGSIAATSGAGVTITSTENVGNVTDMDSVTAGTITATAGTGALNITSNVNVTDTAAIAATTFTAGAISATGGTTITVNETATASAAALAANPGAAGVAGIKTLTVQEGAVTALDGGTATSVTINQGTATAVGATGAVLASAASTVAGGPGYSAVTTAAVAAAAVVPGTLGVTAGEDIVSGTVGTAPTKASATITTVSLDNYATGSYVNSKALTTLTLSGTGAGLAVDNVSASALALNLNALTDAAGLTVAGVKTLNVMTGGSGATTLGSGATTLGASGVAGIAASSMTALNVAGTQTLSLFDMSADAALTAIAVSGSAGFNDNGTFAGTAAGTTLTTTSSGTITATLHSAGTDTFTGSTGQDVITISADQTKAVVGGSATNNELVLSGDTTTTSVYLSGTGHTWGEVSGFSVLGINESGTVSYNAAAMGSNTFNSLDVMSGSTSVTVTNLVKDASLSIDATTSAVVFQTADTTGATDSSTVNLGTTANGYITVTSLSMGDANGVGIATLNIVSNDTAANVTTGGLVNTITTLVDSGLSTLNVSGVDGLTIGALNEGTTLGSSATAATSLTINNTSGGVVTVGTFTDSALGNLTFTGTGNDVVSTLTTSNSSHALTIANTGTGTAAISAFTADTGLTSLTLNGGVALGPDAGAPATVTDTFVAGSGAGPTSATATYVMTGLSAGQSYTVDGVTITADVALTANQVASGLAIDHTTAGVYAISGTYAVPSGWTSVVLSAGSDTFELSSSATGVVATGNPGNAVGGTAQSAATGATTGVTVAAGTDNAHINLNLTGAATGATDSITVGNGNNYIVDGSTAGTVNVTVGTGSNLIALGGPNTDTTGVYNVTLGAHTATTGIDSISIGSQSVSASTWVPTAANLVVTGAVTGDVITFANDVANTLTVATTATTAGSTAAATVAALVTAADATVHQVNYSVFGGNTYVAESGVAGIPSSSNAQLTVIELVGSHTFTGAAHGVIHIA